MKFTILLALAALIISGTAAYFSIVGLAAIFAAAFIPTVIMGSAVEVGKVITVAWLHFDWYNIGKRLKYALCFPVIGVMLITSVGVFGFLSRAHVAQTAAAEESIAQVERIEKEVTRLESVIDRAELKVSDLESGTFKIDNATQEQIDKEQARIDSAYSRVQPAIDEQNAIIAGQTKIFEDQIASIDAELAKLQAYIDAGEIKKAQQMIGEKSKGGWGPKTTETANKWRAERNARKDALLKEIQKATANNQTIIAARKEIQRLRDKAEQQIADSISLVNRLRDKIANSQKADNTDELLDQQYARINKANVDIETLTDEKYTLEAEYRQLEAEVGPIKYIAEFVYREEADSDLLEQAVKWLIILLLICLDPFAILLVMAATDRYKMSVKKKKQAALDLGIDLDQVADLQDELADTLEEKQKWEKANQMRIKEMNELREETQKIIDEANKMESDAEEVQEKLEAAERERDKLQLEIDNPVIPASDLSDEDAETIAELLEERNRLATELENVKNSSPSTGEINIHDESAETKMLRKQLASVQEDYDNLKRIFEKGK